MKTFKEQVAIDLKSTFLNTKEFADYHLLNDKRLLCIVDTNQVNNASYNRSSSFADGIYEYDLKVIYHYEDYPVVLVTDSECYLDKAKYHVHHYSFDDGLVQLQLSKV